MRWLPRCRRGPSGTRQRRRASPLLRVRVVCDALGQSRLCADSPLPFIWEKAHARRPRPSGGSRCRGHPGLIPSGLEALTTQVMQQAGRDDDRRNPNRSPGAGTRGYGRFSPLFPDEAWIVEQNQCRSIRIDPHQVEVLTPADAGKLLRRGELLGKGAVYVRARRDAERVNMDIALAPDDLADSCRSVVLERDLHASDRSRRLVSQAAACRGVSGRVPIATIPLTYLRFFVRPARGCINTDA